MSDASDLVRLQDVDLSLIRYATKLRSMPQQRKLEQIAAAQRKVASELTKLRGQRKDVEIDIAELEERHAVYADKTAEVRSRAEERAQDYRAINDLEAQLTSLAKRSEKVEFELAHKEELLARLKASEEDGARLTERLAQEEQAQRESFAKDTETIRDEVGRLGSERKNLRDALPDELVERYDKAAKRFGGLAVETLHGNVPTTCRVKLQPSTFRDLAKGPVITECPYCHRILVTEEVSDE